MTLDGITLHALVKELTALCGAKIEKVYMPLADEVTLVLHTMEGKRRLTLSSSASDCRIHITEHQKPNPDKAPNFCMLLRKYITGGRILGIEQEGLERVVRIFIDARDDMGAPVKYTLVVEIMGKHSNIMLLSGEEKVIDSIKHVPMDVSTVRQVLPGVSYVLPITSKLNPINLSTQSLADVMRSKLAPDCLLERIQGISKQTAIEVTFRCFHDNDVGKLSEQNAFRLASTLKEFLEEEPCPCIQERNDMPFFYSVVPFETFSTVGRTQYETVNKAVDEYYEIRKHREIVSRRRASLIKAISTRRTKLEKKLAIHSSTLEEDKKAENIKVYAELITANIYAIKRGAKEATVLNYYTNENITIPLDTALSPQSNAQRYFKKYAKLKTAAGLAKKQCELLREELDYLDELLYTAEVVQTQEDFEELSEDLIKCGCISPSREKPKKRKDPLFFVRKFISSDGFIIMAGRNGRSNDMLTLKVASSTDIWFHVRNTPGSHVVLFTKGVPPTDDSLVQAATIAATLSRAKSSGKVVVDYCPRSNVFKSSGAKPGMVFYEGHRSISVHPDADLLLELEG